VNSWGTAPVGSPIGEIQDSCFQAWQGCRSSSPGSTCLLIHCHSQCCNEICRRNWRLRNTSACNHLGSAHRHLGCRTHPGCFCGNPNNCLFNILTIDRSNNSLCLRCNHDEMAPGRAGVAQCQQGGCDRSRLCLHHPKIKRSPRPTPWPVPPHGQLGGEVQRGGTAGRGGGQGVPGPNWPQWASAVVTGTAAASSAANSAAERGHLGVNISMYFMSG